MRGGKREREPRRLSSMPEFSEIACLVSTTLVRPEWSNQSGTRARGLERYGAWLVGVLACCGRLQTSFGAGGGTIIFELGYSYYLYQSPEMRCTLVLAF